MKKITSMVFICLLATITVKSQNLEIGLGLGTGSTYLVENFDSGINVNYAMPFTSYMDLKYSKPENYFGLKLRFQYMNTGIEGENWKAYDEEIDGEVASFTTMILLEHLNTKNNWNLGYNFGLGYTNQSLREQLEQNPFSTESNFMSFNFSGILSKSINENLSFQIEPSLLWTDPVNSLRNRKKWQIAGEDISLLLQLGLKYKMN